MTEDFGVLFDLAEPTLYCPNCDQESVEWKYEKFVFVCADICKLVVLIGEAQGRTCQAAKHS